MLRACLFVVAIAVMGTPALAEEPAYEPPDFLSVTPPLPPGQDVANVWRLDLAEALRIAVRQNLDVALERKSVEVAAKTIDVADGAYEPTVTAGYAHGSQNVVPQVAEEGAAGQTFRSVSDTWSLGINKLFSTGTRVDVGIDNNQLKSSAGNALEPRIFGSTARLTIVQPLLRGFSLDLAIPKLQLLRARIASDRERHQLTISITTIVERTESAYWDVLGALYRYDLAVRTQKLADEQLALTQRQIAAGTRPPSDMIGAESTVAQRRLELLQADQEIQRAWDQLRSVLNLPREQWTRPILPTDVPKYQSTTTNAEDALAIALKNRPELSQLDLDLAASDLAVRKADNDRLPQIDVGVAGRVDGQDNKYSEALAQLGALDARGWNVFVNLTWTPLNRSAGAAAEIARIQRDQTAVTRQQRVQAVWYEVREAVRNQRSADQQVRAAARFRELASQSLEVEQRLYLNGTSDQITVAQRQDAVARAQLAEIDALVAHNRAAASLFRATGRLLPERHIELVSK
ncbi:MAG: TolC family protein [Kofleriaceae bacterium]